MTRKKAASSVLLAVDFFRVVQTFAAREEIDGRVSAVLCHVWIVSPRPAKR
jgi:hypothetical protein